MRYFVQYRTVDGRWVIYSRHNKEARADAALRKLAEFYRPMRFPPPIRIVTSGARGETE